MDLNNLPGLPEDRPEDYNPFTDENSPFYGLDPGWRPTGQRPIPTMRCYYVKKNGEPCKNRAIRGSGLNGTKPMCQNHGGRLTNPRKKADEMVNAARIALADNLPDAVMKLVEMVTSEDIPEQVRLNAIKEVMDRSGLKGGADLSITVNEGTPPSEKLFEKMNSLRGEKPKELEDLGEVVDEEEES